METNVEYGEGVPVGRGAHGWDQGPAHRARSSGLLASEAGRLVGAAAAAAVAVAAAAAAARAAKLWEQQVQQQKSAILAELQHLLGCCRKPRLLLHPLQMQLTSLLLRPPLRAYSPVCSPPCKSGTCTASNTCDITGATFVTTGARCNGTAAPCKAIPATGLRGLGRIYLAHPTALHCPSHNLGLIKHSYHFTPPTAACDDPCKNGGVCVSEGECDCTGTGYTGPTCKKPSETRHGMFVS
jgi:hypothetical protein